MRDVISYELSEKLGQYTTRRVYCEVMVNGDYKGLYVFMEKIKADDNRANIDKDGGYIVQTDRAENGTPAAWTMPEYGNGWWGGDIAIFVHHYPKYENITTAQNEYIKSVFFDLADKAGNHNISIENGFPSIIDVSTFVDFMIMGEFSSNVDVYQLSTFFHKDRKGKLRAGPIWDYNLAYGHDEFGSRSRYDVWQFDNGDNVGPKFWKDLFDTDEFRCYLAKRWFEVTAEGNALDYNQLCNRIDEIAEIRRFHAGVAAELITLVGSRFDQHTAVVREPLSDRCFDDKGVGGTRGIDADGSSLFLNFDKSL